MTSTVPDTEPPNMPSASIVLSYRVRTPTWVLHRRQAYTIVQSLLDPSTLLQDMTRHFHAKTVSLEIQ